MDNQKPELLRGDSRYNRQAQVLLNGWIVIHVFESKVYITSYLSKDDGYTWTETFLY